jgi:hypothetical protein
MVEILDQKQAVCEMICEVELILTSTFHDNMFRFK